jgi:hypothetical protein
VIQLPEVVTADGMQQDSGLRERLEALERQVADLQAERDIRILLARYCFGADSGRHEEYLALFTDDAIIESQMYGSDNLVDLPDPNVVETRRFVGRQGVADYINSPAHMSIEGRSQHHMLGPPSAIYVDGDTAVADSYSVVYAKAEGNLGPTVDFQTHGFIRWKFRRVDGAWKICESIRRRMGTPAQQDVLSHFRMQ